ncbi:MAG: putative destabilase [Prokaryotic dsDNA virus sp.]|nr:MAG: putative destabilase [Prokaryotic dsDNA virus sp.]|tara:strand:- start:20372 stop:20818 length:447 start_codon:yes stop_codon:yes gene_type:complete
MVETGGHEDPTNAVGEAGELGPYQITRAYWEDAVEFMPPSDRGCYDDVRNGTYAERIMTAYWARYAPDMQPETLARIHNGGPRGHLKKSTEKYWKRVRQVFQTCKLVGDWQEMERDQAESGGSTRPDGGETARPSFGRSFYQRVVGRK